MNASLCHRLMDYRERSLPDAERAEFERHLAECVRCQQELAAENRLDQLLLRAVPLAMSPPGLVDRVELRLVRVGRRRRVAWASGLAAAGVVIVLLAWQQRLARPKTEDEIPRPVAREHVVSPTPSPGPHAPVTVAFAPESRVIARAIPTDNPAVTLIWVYPAIQAAADADSSLLQTP